MKRVRYIRRRENMNKEINNVIKAYKGFDKDLSCRGFQYEIGKEYELPANEKVSVCNTGFHACESPLEVLDYYFLNDKCEMSRFCEVEQSGDTDRENNGSTKVASTKIRIKAELKFADLIKLGVEWLKEKTSISNDELNDNSGDYAQIGSSGYSAKINSTGEGSVICCAGHGSIVKAKQGSWITLAEWVYSEEKKRYVPKCVKTEYVDGERIKADTWYELVDGEFKEETNG